MSKILLTALVFTIIGLLAIWLIAGIARLWVKDKIEDLRDDENGDSNRPM